MQIASATSRRHAEAAMAAERKLKLRDGDPAPDFSAPTNGGGAVTLGRVQTPTLAIIARREEGIRAFKPEPYWLVDATFEPTSGESGRAYSGRYHDGSQPRLKTAAAAEAIVEAVRGRTGEITKLETTKRSEKAPLLYDLTSLQREANTRYGFSARRTLAAAQRACRMVQELLLWGF